MGEAAADRTHECPAPGCPIRVPRAQLACRSHWFALPSTLRSKVNGSWRRRPFDRHAHAEALREAVDYLEALGDRTPREEP